MPFGFSTHAAETAEMEEIEETQLRHRYFIKRPIMHDSSKSENASILMRSSTTATSLSNGAVMGSAIPGAGTRHSSYAGQSPNTTNAKSTGLLSRANSRTPVASVAPDKIDEEGVHVASMDHAVTPEEQQQQQQQQRPAPPPRADPSQRRQLRRHGSIAVPGASEMAGASTEPEADSLAEKLRFELFIDLIWVGIVSNLAESFSEAIFSVGENAGSEADAGRSNGLANPGTALGNFTLLFLMSWRMWKQLQDFMTKYATNDVIERAFCVWILVLAAFYGNNAPFLFQEGKNQSDIGLVIFMISKSSLLALEAAYAFFLPVLRRDVYLRILLAAPMSAPFIGAFFVPTGQKSTLVGVGIAIEVIFHFFCSWPPFVKFFNDDELSDATPEYDVEHNIERMRDFFIIILGDGVLDLIRGDPLGRGFTANAAAGLLALIIYYVLGGLYFNGDGSRNYIHAVRRSWWMAEVWVTVHVLLFHSTLVLGSAVGFIVENPLANGVEAGFEDKATTNGTLSAQFNATASDTSDNGDNKVLDDAYLSLFMRRAKWIIGLSLAVALVTMSLLAVSAKSLDRRGTIKVDSRYLRISGRLVAVLVAVFLPLATSMNGMTMLGIIIAPMTLTLLVEWYVCLDKDGGLYEKKSKSRS